MNSGHSIELLIGQMCPYRFAILGAVLIDKEISESRNFMALSARLKGQSRDQRLLRILFESRIKQRLTLSVTSETIATLKRVHAKNIKAEKKVEAAHA